MNPGHQIGRINDLGPSQSAYTGLGVNGPAYTTTAVSPRESGEINIEVQRHHDLISDLFAEIDALQDSLTLVSQLRAEGLSPAKEVNVPRLSSIGAQLQEDNNRLSNCIDKIRATRFALVI